LLELRDRGSGCVEHLAALGRRKDQLGSAIGGVGAPFEVAEVLELVDELGAGGQAQIGPLGEGGEPSGEASTLVDASPAEIYSLVSDVRRMGEWSPECRRCEWVDGATGPQAGARFKGTNGRGIARWSTTPTVSVAEPGHEFAFVTSHLGRNMTSWTYRFEPVSQGTRVTESFELLRDMPWYFRLADRLLMGVTDRQADLETNLEETLRRLKAAAEHRESGPPDRGSASDVGN
jgi:hypothetical protein